MNGAKQDNSYSNRLRFLRGKIALLQYKPSPAQALITPGINSPQSAYMTVQDGRILASYKSLSTGGVDISAPGCCSSCQPVCPVSTIPPYDGSGNPNLDTNTPQFITFNTQDGNGGILPYAELVAFLEVAYGPGTLIPDPPEGYPYGYFFALFYPPYCNSTSQTVQVLDESGNQVPSQITDLGPSSIDYFQNGLGGFVIIYPSNLDNFEGQFTLTVSNSCSSETGDADFFCFLEGSPVTLADGTTKPIETIAVGDRVVGAFGEINTVTALQKNPLGLATISNINGDHMTTSHHPHVRADHKFACVTPAVMPFAYGKNHWVTVADGKQEKRVMTGVSRDRIVKLEVGMQLQTLTGPREVTSIERVPMDRKTPVYHLAVDGSHTYVVDGYAVVGWADDTDFDYDAWVPKA